MIKLFFCITGVVFAQLALQSIVLLLSASIWSDGNYKLVLDVGLSVLFFWVLVVASQMFAVKSKVGFSLACLFVLIIYNSATTIVLLETTDISRELYEWVFIHFLEISYGTTTILFIFRAHLKKY